MSSAKHFTEVLIGGKVFTLSGFESEEYLQKVSTYLNHKIDECSSSEGYRKQSAETRSVLLALNIADDYFKARKQGGTLESDIEAKDKEMYDLKHELISVQIKLENADKALDKSIASNMRSSFRLSACALAPKRLPPIYIASAPAQTAASRHSHEPAGASISISLFILISSLN